MEHLMTSEEVAEYLHVDPVTIRRLVNKGDLAAYRIGADYRFAPSDVEDYLQRQRIAGGKGFRTSPFTEFTPGEQTMVTSDRFDKFTPQARKALSLAQEEVQHFQHPSIDPEHLLLGLIREGEGIAAQVLSNLGADLHQARSAVEPPMERGHRIVLGKIGFSPHTRKVIELAVDEVRRLDQHLIGTAHLLLGIVREGSAAGVLERLGVQPAKVRTETIRMLQQRQGDDSAAFPSVPLEAASLLAADEPYLTCSRCGARCPVYFHHCFNCGQRLDHG